MKFTEISKTKLTEAFDNPYPFKLTGPDDSQSFTATANTPNGPLTMEFSSTDFDDFGIDFSIGKSMGKTDAGDEFRVFATVVAIMKKWISTVGIEHVEGFDFGANKDEHASDGRARLYTRFAKQLASQLGWKLEQSTTGNGSTAFFRLTNPKPIPRDDEYWDALEENVEVSLHGDAKKGYTLSKIEVSGDERNAGQGTKAMQDIVDRMDREGAIIALTPDDAFGGNKNRLIKFYKRFGFVPNKGRNKDFRFRETMIRYPQTNEAVNEVSKEEFNAIQNGYVDIEFDKKWWPLDDDYPLIKHIGKAIGATSWTSWGKVGVPWSETEMIGGGGTYMLKGDFGHILLDAAKSFRPEQILMAQISTSNRGGGVGVKVMNAIKSYADQKGLPLIIYKVTNKKFFDKFKWLTKTGEDTYEYNSSKVEEGRVNEGYKLQLERDADMMVLNITDTATGKRTEVRGKAGYETNGYDKNDKLHQLLDKISKTANISELMNGEPVGINPKHPDAKKAKSATDTAFNEETGAEMLSIFQKMHHDAGNNDEMDAFIQSHDWKLRDFTPDMFPSEEEFFDYDDPFGRIIDIDYYHNVDLSSPIIVGPQYSDGKYSVVDGNHRAAKAQQLGKTIKGYFPVKKVNETAGVGRIVKGVNTTVDVGPDEIIKQVKKFGNDVDRDGKPNKHLR